MDHDEVVRRYGPWRGRTPGDAAELFEGYPGRWWIAGGWAIEAFTGSPRPHDDVDPSILRSDVPALLRHLRGSLDVWAADGRVLAAVVEESDPVPETCENLWLRRGGDEPWEYDVILMDATPSTWTFKRDARVSLPLQEIVWTKDGVTYLRPEVQLLHKASAVRPKDQVDFDTCLPLLEDAARAWLRSALVTAHPGHPWLAAL